MIGWYRAMRTRRIERQVYRHVMEVLDDPKHGPSIARWLAKDPERTIIYRRVAGEIGRASDAAVLMPELLDEPVTGSRPGSSQRALLIGGSAVFLTAIVATGFGLTSRPLHHDNARVAGSTGVVSPALRTIRLPDGSQVELRGPVQIVSYFGGRERSVRLLAGTATFSVAHDPTRPFVVHAGGGSVTAIGTRFEVQAGQRIMVHLISGIVSVRMPGPSPGGAGKQIRIVAGQQIAFDGAPAGTPAGSVKERVAFDDAPVSAVVSAVNDGATDKIILDDPAIGTRHVFAELDISKPLAVAENLAATLDLGVRQTATGEIHLAQKK